MYSHKDFTGRSLTAHKIAPQVIRGSCFSQETPDSVVFPPDMTGVTFEYCNLDNCVIPDRNTVIECSTRKFKVQTDGHDWEVLEDGFPTNVVNYSMFNKFGIPLPNPLELPDVAVERPIDYFDPARNVRA